MKEATNLIEINTDQAFDKSMEEVYRHIEPLVIHVRPGGSDIKNADGSKLDLRKQIIDNLAADHGFVNLDVDKIQRGENERGTSIGQEL